MSACFSTNHQHGFYFHFIINRLGVLHKFTVAIVMGVRRIVFQFYFDVFLYKLLISVFFL